MSCIEKHCHTKRLLERKEITIYYQPSIFLSRFIALKNCFYFLVEITTWLYGMLLLKLFSFFGQLLVPQAIIPFGPRNDRSWSRISQEILTKA